MGTKQLGAACKLLHQTWNIWKIYAKPRHPSLSSSPSNWTAVAGFVLAEIQSCFFGKSHLDIIGTNPKRTVGQIPWTIESRLEQFDCSHENFSVATHPHIALFKLTDLRKKSNGILLNVFTELHLKWSQPRKFSIFLLTSCNQNQFSAWPSRHSHLSLPMELSMVAAAGEAEVIFPPLSF